MKKIVILDGHALHSETISWQPLKDLGELTVYEDTTPQEVAERIAEADFVFTNKVPISAEAMDSAPNLKWIGVLATGYDGIDIKHARERGIPVANIPAYSTPTVAQNIFAHILNICNRISDHSASVSDGKWTRLQRFTYCDYPQIELSGKTLGVVGFGGIGKKVAEIAQGFDMNVLVNTPHPKPEFESDTLKFTDIETLLKESDIISLHCPLKDSTYGIIDAKAISLMKPTAILINTARGPLINEDDLAKALQENRIYAAGLDVLSSEPPASDNPLLKCENCFITPHTGWASNEAKTRLYHIAMDNIHSFLEGNPQNVVNM